MKHAAVKNIIFYHDVFTKYGEGTHPRVDNSYNTNLVRNRRDKIRTEATKGLKGLSIKEGKSSIIEQNPVECPSMDLLNDHSSYKRKAN
jgi:hypothetical protein